MTKSEALEPRRRNRNYEDSHRILIDTAIALMAKSGTGTVSVSALARATGINRTTIYYHFDTREDLMSAVRERSLQELAKSADPGLSGEAGIDHISSFLLRNPDFIQLCIDDYIAIAEIRRRYPEWDRLVAQIAEVFADEPGDAEICCVLMLTSTLISSRLFKSSVSPHECLARMVSGLSAGSGAQRVNMPTQLA